MTLLTKIRNIFKPSSDQEILDDTINVIEKRLRDIEKENHKTNYSIIDYNNSSVTGKLRVIFKILKRALGLDKYYPNKHSFKSLRSAYENEVYVRRTVDQYTESVVRNGFSIIGENDDDVQYIMRRMEEFEMVSSVSMEENIRMAAGQLILYGNLIASKVRNEKASSGKRYIRFDGKEIIPIAALFIEDARSIQIKQDNKKGLVYIRHTKESTQDAINAQTGLSIGIMGLYQLQQFKNDLDKPTVMVKDDIFHLGFHRHSGDMWATPPLSAVLDDIRVLRLIEENIELLSFQYSHPILHVKVGDDKVPGDKSEVNDVTNKVEDMESNGFIATSNRVNMEFISQSSSIDLMDYVNYFKSRVFAGLHMSDVSMGSGDTANRNSADYLSKDVINRTIEIQSYIRMMYDSLFKELLLERGYDYEEVNHHSHRVQLSFPEVDISSKIKTEEHYLNMYNQNLITLDEARKLIGLKPITEEEENRLYYYVIKNKEFEFQANKEKEIQLELNKINNTKTALIKPNVSKSKSNNKTNQNLNPINQYGKKTDTKPPKK